MTASWRWTHRCMWLLTAGSGTASRRVERFWRGTTRRWWQWETALDGSGRRPRWRGRGEKSTVSLGLGFYFWWLCLVLGFCPWYWPESRGSTK
ncbi:uncharacterized protein M6B38_203905 [Iris pallida]|uniref:Uncharacterized protein n=1 Tax=Iris pallida TaxID=29817 RepID=A0AAX6E7A5_IRIPA|nr:uncharacterized protein M6B38_203905 [Iris pallida]